MNSSSNPPRLIKTNDPHSTEVQSVLGKELGAAGMAKAVDKAKSILEKAVDPTAGTPSQPSDGLLYGLIQSGKTSILTLASAMAVDNGFDCIQYRLYLHEETLPASARYTPGQYPRQIMWRRLQVTRL